MLIYINYFDQVNNLLLYILLIVFGVVVATLILFWGLKPYLTRLLFGSKVADSPDLIAEAQGIASQLSDGVIDKVMENATAEQREKAKGLVLRLGNWFVWGRLRNWWWSWILGIFVSLGGLTGTLLLVNQNELLQNQNQLIKNQMSLEEASRRGALVMLMSNIFDKVDREIEGQKEKLKVVTDSTKFSLSQSLIGQIAALSQAFKPYRFMDGDTMIMEPLSPERGQLLVTICGLPLDSMTLKRVFESSTFESADLRKANLKRAKLSKVNLASANLREVDLRGAILNEAVLNYANLANAQLSYAQLNLTHLPKANLTGADLSHCSLKRSAFVEAILINAILNASDLSGSIFTDASLVNADLTAITISQETFFWKANLKGADLSYSDFSKTKLDKAQLLEAMSLYKTKLPPSVNVLELKKSYPSLFEDPYKE